MKLLAFVVAFALILSGCTYTAPAVWPTGWQDVAILGVLAAAFSLAIFYMLGKGLEIQALEMWVRSEYSQLAVTMMILAGLGLLVWSLDSVILPGFIGTTQASQLALAPAGFLNCPPALQTAQGITQLLSFSRCYTNGVITKLSSYTARMRGLSEEVGKTSSLSTYCNALSVLGFSITPCRQVGSTQPTLGLLLTALSTGISAMRAQLLLLEVAPTLLALFLPLGIILRSFSYTRAAGGALLALAIGFLAVYPVMILINYELARTSTTLTPAGFMCARDSDCPQSEQCMIPAGSTTGTCSLPTLTTNPIFPGAPKITQSVTIGADCKYSDYYDITHTGRPCTTDDDPNPANRCNVQMGEVCDVSATPHECIVLTGLFDARFYEFTIFWAIIISLLLPVMNILITLTIVKWPAGFIGSEIEVAGLARLT